MVLGVFPQSERLVVRFLVRARAWVVGSVPVGGSFERHWIDVSLFFSSLKINKNLKKEKVVEVVFLRGSH